MATAEYISSAKGLELPARSRSDWVGAIVFSGIAVWLMVTGWIPVARQSIFAAILILPNWLTPVVNAIGFIRRGPAIRVSRDWSARLVAHVVTFSLPIYFTVAAKHLQVRATGLPFVAAMLVGTAAGAYMLWGAWALRESWSVEPQARALVTSGPFEFSRHPLYTSYMLRNISVLVLYMNLGLSFFLVLWTVLLLHRIHCEEHILTECYPEYEQFRGRVWMFSPRLF